MQGGSVVSLKPNFHFLMMFWMLLKLMSLFTCACITSLLLVCQWWQGMPWFYPVEVKGDITLGDFQSSQHSVSFEWRNFAQHWFCAVPVCHLLIDLESCCSPHTFPLSHFNDKREKNPFRELARTLRCKLFQQFDVVGEKHCCAMLESHVQYLCCLM